MSERNASGLTTRPMPPERREWEKGDLGKSERVEGARAVDRDVYVFSDGIEITGEELARARLTDTPMVRLYYEKKAALARAAMDPTFLGPSRPTVQAQMEALRNADKLEAARWKSKTELELEAKANALTRARELGFDPATIRVIPWPWHLHWLGVIGMALDTCVDPYGAYKRGAQLELDR